MVLGGVQDAISDPVGTAEDVATTTYEAQDTLFVGLLPGGRDPGLGLVPGSDALGDADSAAFSFFDQLGFAGALPSGADPGFGGGGGNDQSDDSDGSGLPSWLLPAGIVAAAVVAVVIGGDM